jgi:hypothetical protein
MDESINQSIMAPRLISRYKSFINKHAQDMAKALNSGREPPMSRVNLHQKLMGYESLENVPATPRKGHKPARAISTPGTDTPAPPAPPSFGSPLRGTATPRRRIATRSASAQRAIGGPSSLVDTPSASEAERETVSTVTVTGMHGDGTRRSKRGRESPVIDGTEPRSKRPRLASSAQDKDKRGTKDSRGKRLRHHTLEFVGAEDRQSYLHTSLGPLQTPHNTPRWMDPIFSTADIDMGRLLSREMVGEDEVTLGFLLHNGYVMETLEGDVLRSSPTQYML